MKRQEFDFFHGFRVRYSEIDAQGVVFNAHHLTYFDTTITEFFRHRGFDQFADAKATGIDFHVVKAVVEYKAPLLFDQEFEVGLRVGRMGRSSVTFELAIFGKGAARLFATGEVVWVAADQRTHASVPVPEHVRVKLGG